MGRYNLHNTYDDEDDTRPPWWWAVVGVLVLACIGAGLQHCQEARQQATPTAPSPELPK